MKQTSGAAAAWGPALFLLFFLPAVACSGGEEGATQEIAPAGPAAYAAPAEKAKLWEDLRNVARRDYEVCREHCGYEQSCLDRCETAYKNRLENEYKRLTE